MCVTVPHNFKILRRCNPVKYISMYDYLYHTDTLWFSIMNQSHGTWLSLSQARSTNNQGSCNYHDPLMVSCPILAVTSHRFALATLFEISFKLYTCMPWSESGTPARAFVWLARVRGSFDNCMTRATAHSAFLYWKLGVKVNQHVHFGPSAQTCSHSEILRSATQPPMRANFEYFFTPKNVLTLSARGIFTNTLSAPERKNWSGKCTVER